MSNIFSSGEKEDFRADPFRSKLLDLTENLYYLSETEAPIEPYSESASDDEEIRSEIAGSVGEIDFDEFFRRLTRIHEGSNDVARERAQRFAALKDFLESELTDLRVIRSGTIRIDIRVVGRDSNGCIRGFRTFAVET